MYGFNLKQKLEEIGLFLKDLGFKPMHRYKFWEGMLNDKVLFIDDAKNRRFIMIKFYRLPKNVWCDDLLDPMKNLKNNFNYQSPRFFIKEYSYKKVIKKLIELDIIDEYIDQQFQYLVYAKHLGVCRNKTEDTITLNQFYNNKLIKQLVKNEIISKTKKKKEKKYNKGNKKKMRVMGYSIVNLEDINKIGGVWQIVLKKLDKDNKWKITGTPKFIGSGFSKKAKENSEWLKTQVII